MAKMKGFRSLILAVITLSLIFTGIGCKPAVTPSSKVYEWKMGTIYRDPVVSPIFNAQGLAMQKFVELVTEKTGGRVVISPYYNSVLGSTAEMYEQVRRGELDACFAQPLSSIDSRLGAFNVGYTFPDFAAVEKLIANKDGPLFKLAQSWIDENNGYLLCTAVGVFRGFFNSKHRVATVSDVRDLKVRIYQDPVVGLFWSGICNAAPMAFSEVYTALQTKTIDGLEFQATAVMDSKYYDIGKYYSDINWQWCWNTPVVLSKKAWNELPEDLKKIVSDCGWEAMDVFKTQEYADEVKAEEALEAQGVEVYHLTDVERKTWTDYARSLDSKMRDLIGAETFDAVMKIINDYKG